MIVHHIISIVWLGQTADELNWSFCQRVVVWGINIEFPGYC